MACYVDCSDCSGTGLLADPVEPCVYCDGKGYVEERIKSAAELNAEVRFQERLLLEPGFEMAFLFLLDQRLARFDAEVEALTRGKAA